MPKQMSRNAGAERMPETSALMRAIRRGWELGSAYSAVSRKRDANVLKSAELSLLNTQLPLRAAQGKTGCAAGVNGVVVPCAAWPAAGCIASAVGGLPCMGGSRVNSNGRGVNGGRLFRDNLGRRESNAFCKVVASAISASVKGRSAAEVDASDTLAGSRALLVAAAGGVESCALRTSVRKLFSCHCRTAATQFSGVSSRASGAVS